MVVFLKTSFSNERAPLLREEKGRLENYRIVPYVRAARPNSRAKESHASL
jgi:hypothetical protein